MRVLLVEPGPQFSVQDVASGWSRALVELGCEVQVLRLGEVLTFYDRSLDAVVPDEDRRPNDTAVMAADYIKVKCYEQWPDLVIVVSAFYVPPMIYELMRNRGHKVVVLFTESPYEDDNQMRLAPFADWCVLNDPTNLDGFLELNPNTLYLPHAYDPAVHYRRDAEPDKASDFCFVGTGYPSRVAFFEACDWTGIDVCLAGNWQALDVDSPLRKYVAHDVAHCVDNTEAVELYSAAKVSANLYRTEAGRPELSRGWAMGPREVELAATGTFYLTEARGENREILPMVPTFDGPDDLVEQVRWWLTQPVRRAEVARKAKAAIQDRTFTNHARRLLEAVSS